MKGQATFSEDPLEDEDFSADPEEAEDDEESDFAESEEELDDDTVEVLLPDPRLSVR